MDSKSQSFLSFLRRNRLRVGVYSFVAILAVASGGGLAYANHHLNDQLAADSNNRAASARQAAYLKRYTDLSRTLAAFKEKGGDVTAYTEKQASIKSFILAGDYGSSDLALKELASTVNTASTALATTQAEKDAAAKLALQQEADKADITGIITEGGKPLEGAIARLFLASDLVAEATVGTDGKYSFRAAAGTYNVAGAKPGYPTVTVAITVVAKQALTQDIALVKSAPTPTPTPKATATPRPAATATPGSSAQSNGSGSYERRTVSTSRGSFTVDLLTIDLTKARVITDSASDTECANGCATNSLQGYVNAHGGFAGMNGTYFCPPDYSTCAGQTNSYFWKVWDTGIGRAINANNGLGDNDAFLGFGTDGSARYFRSWSSFVSSGYSVSAGINCKPRLVEGGANVLSDAEMDDKQRTTKSNRGAIGVTGSTLYAVIAKSATVPDLAAIMVALGVQNAINLDGGGSSAMTFEGSYKVGPGRALPNAIVFKAR